MASELLRLIAEREIVARERPPQAGDRSLGQRSREDDLPDGDRLRSADVADEDRRTHAARTVRLHPTRVGEGATAHALEEELDHVVPLGLAVHQHVDADLLLDAHIVANLVLDECRVLGRHDLLLDELVARHSNLASLREGADPSRTARVIVWTSAHFSVANANQSHTAGSSVVTLAVASESTVCGVCSSEDEVATMTRRRASTPPGAPGPSTTAGRTSRCCDRRPHQARAPASDRAPRGRYRADPAHAPDRVHTSHGQVLHWSPEYSAVTVDGRSNTRIGSLIWILVAPASTSCCSSRA